MPQAVQIALAVLSFLVENRDTIRKLVLDVEALIPDAPGASKAASVKQFIAASISAGDQLDAAWPLISPVFNLLVAAVKGTKPAAA